MSPVLKMVAVAILPVWVSLAGAQPVIGYLGAESPERFASRLDAFRKGLAEMKYTEGKNVSIEYRWAKGDNSRLPALAAELVQKRVSVLVAPGSAVSAYAAKQATSTIPIVFELGIDPVAGGLVESMSRPGGNATGVTSLNTQVMAKRLQLLHEIVPKAKSLALLVNPTNPRNAEAVTKDLQAAAGSLGLKLHVLQAASDKEIGSAMDSVARIGAGGLVVTNDTFFANRGKEMGAMSLAKRVPAIQLSPEFVAGGGLISYMGNFLESHRLAGVQTGRVLNGENPATLPVQQVTKTQLFVNLKTAKTLGVSVPPSILVQADEVIR